MHFAGGRPHQLQDRASECRLAATAFADETERLAPSNVEIDAVERMHCTDPPASQ
jgi:hypothetical protein